MGKAGGAWSGCGGVGSRAGQAGCGRVGKVNRWEGSSCRWGTTQGGCCHGYWQGGEGRKLWEGPRGDLVRGGTGQGRGGAVLRGWHKLRDGGKGKNKNENMGH